MDKEWILGSIRRAGRKILFTNWINTIFMYYLSYTNWPAEFTKYKNYGKLSIEKKI